MAVLAVDFEIQDLMWPAINQPNWPWARAAARAHALLSQTASDELIDELDGAVRTLPFRLSAVLAG